jgi:hypothetical protein
MLFYLTIVDIQNNNYKDTTHQPQTGNIDGR